MATNSLKIKLRHIHEHINVLKWHLILSLAKKKKKRKVNLMMLLEIPVHGQTWALVTLLYVCLFVFCCWRLEHVTVIPDQTGRRRLLFFYCQMHDVHLFNVIINIFFFFEHYIWPVEKKKVKQWSTVEVNVHTGKKVCMQWNTNWYFEMRK